MIVFISMLEAIGAGVTPRIGSRDWKDIWLDSPECAKAKEEIKQMKAEALAKPAETNLELTKTCAFLLYLILSARFLWLNLERCNAILLSGQDRH